MERPYSWQRFAHTLNGYEVAGGMEQLGQRVKVVYDHWQQGKPLSDLPTVELRLSLFLSARAERHGGYPWEDTRREEAILAELRSRNGEPWMQEQLSGTRA